MMKNSKKLWEYYTTDNEPSNAIDYSNIPQHFYTPSTLQSKFNSGFNSIKLLSKSIRLPAIQSFIFIFYHRNLAISLRKRDEGFQPRQLPGKNIIRLHNLRPTLYRQWLTWQITLDHSMDLAKEETS